MSPNHFDAIIIGSGIGGMTVARILTHFYKKKVLLLEQHYIFGGFTHSFSRLGKYTWDVGLHYVGDMGSNSRMRLVMDFVTGGRVKWQKFAEPCQYFVYPDRKYSVCGDPQKQKEYWQKEFPEEKEKIEQYFKDIKTVISWGKIAATFEGLPRPVGAIIRKFNKKKVNLAESTTKEYFDRLGVSEKLRSALDSQWMDYGMKMDQSLFSFHATIIWHYEHGAWYPVGGSQRIGEEVKKLLLEKNCQIKLNSRVEKILIENGAATGVQVSHTKTKKQEEFFAPLIISNAGAKNTYLKLLNHVPIPFRKELEEAPLGSSFLDLFIGLKKCPSTIGVKGENYWIFDDYDQNKVWNNRHKITEGKPPFAFVSFGSMNDCEAKGHTAQVLALTDYEFFKQWKDMDWKKRGPEYEALKKQFTQSILDFVEKTIPGFRDLVDYTELSTPLTVEHFSHHPGGQVYGTYSSKDRLNMKWHQSRTPIKGLYLTGADSGGCGIVGAMMSGIFTLSTIYGISIYPKVFSGGKKAAAQAAM